MIRDLLLVALGGGAGAVCRHLVSLAGLRVLGAGFPWGTITVNILGSFLMGVFIEYLAHRLNSSLEFRLMIATGFLGGFTTFSSFSLDVAVLWERGEPGLAFVYVASSLLIGVSALFGGLYLARATFAA
ncbi:fluoride efflux transporter CrcB [Polycladidibacter hongkongensis]|uniref:fluoride efflux transporter CrcB n=1 Tax=Polycladidibacter hongkongensis TaxID=1647556 RepID=UPI000A78FEC6